MSDLFIDPSTRSAQPLTRHGFSPLGLTLILIWVLGGCATQQQASDVEWVGEFAVPVVEEAPDVKSRNAERFDEALNAMELENLDAAEQLLLQITEDQPELAGPWINLSHIHMAKGETRAARFALEQAVAANPANCDAHTLLGVMARQAGDFQTAEKQYRTCLLVRPDFKDAYLNLGILYELYLGKLDLALDAYRSYQGLLDEPDRKVQGWVMDLERRLGV